MVTRMPIAMAEGTIKLALLYGAEKRFLKSLVATKPAAAETKTCAAKAAINIGPLIAG